MMDHDPYEPGQASLDKGRSTKTGGILAVFKKILIGFGVIFGIIVILLIWAGFSTSKTHNKFKDTAEPFIHSFLSSQSPWSYEKAKPDLSKAWFAAVEEEDSEKLFHYLNKLGMLRSVKSIEWLGCINQAHTSGSVERCNYSVTAEYENGGALIRMGIAIENENLKLMQLNVNSDTFMEQ